MSPLLTAESVRFASEASAARINSINANVDAGSGWKEAENQESKRGRQVLSKTVLPADVDEAYWGSVEPESACSTWYRRT